MNQIIVGAGTDPESVVVPNTLTQNQSKQIQSHERRFYDMKTTTTIIKHTNIDRKFIAEAILKSL